MPRQNHTIAAFHGGINNASDARDIKDEYSADLIDADITSVGKIKVVGHEHTHYASETPGGATIQPGYGLFPFRSDALGSGAAGSQYITFTQTQDGGEGDISLAQGSITFGFYDETGQTTFRVQFSTDSDSWSDITSVIVAIRGDTAQEIANKVLAAGNSGYWDFFSAGANARVNINAVYPGDVYNGYFRLNASDGNIGAFDSNIEHPSGGSNNAPQINAVTIVNQGDTSNAAAVTYYIRLNDDFWTIAAPDVTTSANIAAEFADGSGVDGTSTALDIQKNGVSVVGIDADSGYSVSDSSNVITITKATNGSFNIDVGVQETEGYAGNRWLALCDRSSSGATINLYSNNTGGWTKPFNLGTPSDVSPYPQPSFYHVDGALRVADGNYDLNIDKVAYNSETQPKWYGYIDRYYYGDADDGHETGAGARSGYRKTQFISSNTSLTPLNLVDATKDGITLPDQIANAISLRFDDASVTGSTWAVGVNTVYEVAVSTLYDDAKQESTLSLVADTISVDNGNDLQVKFHLWADHNGVNTSVNGIHDSYPRVTGFHIYMREQTTNEWFLQWEVDISKGIRFFKTGNWVQWDSTGASANVAFCQSAVEMDPIMIETYEIMTGHDAGLDNVSLDTAGNGWKTAVIANRRAWIGNVKMQDEHGDTKVFGDTMVRSRVNKFDSFTMNNKVDVAIRDGEDIVKLEEFADRILQFKHNTLYIINISQEFEFLEGSFKYRGILNPAASCRTGYGIAWINEHGAFFYDGKTVTDLLEKGGVNVLDQSTWASFVNQFSMIGYDPKGKNLVIVRSYLSNTSENSGDTYIYNLVTQSWMFGTDSFGETKKSNFAVDWEGNLILARTGTTGTQARIYRWKYDDPQASTTFTVKTKDIDFGGQPARRKKIYRTYVTYKSDGNPNLKMSYAYDGSTTFTDTSTLSDTSGAWTTEKIATSITNANTFQLQFSPDDAIHTGTCESGSTTTTIRLDLDANSADDYYNNYWILLTAGTGVGQSQKITDYTVLGAPPTTLTATVGGWAITPDTTTEFYIGALPPNFEINDISIIHRVKPVR